MPVIAHGWWCDRPREQFRAINKVARLAGTLPAPAPKNLQVCPDSQLSFVIPLKNNNTHENYER
jgi:hypothetical protein